MNALPTLHQAHVARPATSTPRRSQVHHKVIDSLEAERRAQLADHLDAVRSDLEHAIDLIIDSTHSEPALNKKRAKKQLVGAWITIAHVVQALSQPTPTYRPDVGTPRPIVRRHRRDVEGVEDLEPVSVPAWVGVRS